MPCELSSISQERRIWSSPADQWFARKKLLRCIGPLGHVLSDARWPVSDPSDRRDRGELTAKRLKPARKSFGALRLEAEQLGPGPRSPAPALKRFTLREYQWLRQAPDLFTDGLYALPTQLVGIFQPTGRHLSTEISGDRSGRVPSPLSTPPRSHSRTSPSRPRPHRLPRTREAASAIQRSGRRGCRST